MVKTPYRFLISHQTQNPPCCKKARLVLRWLQVWEKKILLLGRYSKPLLMWDTWSRCLWRYIGRNQMVAGARTLFCTEARSLLLINELYDTNWWNSGHFSGYDIFQSSYSLKQTGTDRVLLSRVRCLYINWVLWQQCYNPCFEIIRLSIIFMFSDTDNTVEERKLKD